MPPQLGYLIHRDSLTRCRKAQLAFADFTEAPLTFPPTSKYIVSQPAQGRGAPPSVDAFMDSRIPQWSARILSFRRPAHALAQLHYTACLNFKSCEHRPVVAVYALCALRIDPARKALLRAKLLAPPPPPSCSTTSANTLGGIEKDNVGLGSAMGSSGTLGSVCGGEKWL